MKTLNINGKNQKVNAILIGGGGEAYKAKINGCIIDANIQCISSISFTGRYNKYYTLDGVKVGDNEKKVLESVITKYKVAL